MHCGLRWTVKMWIFKYKPFTHRRIHFRDWSDRILINHISNHKKNFSQEGSSVRFCRLFYWLVGCPFDLSGQHSKAEAAAWARQKQQPEIHHLIFSMQAAAAVLEAEILYFTLNIYTRSNFGVVFLFICARCRVKNAFFQKEWG